MTFHNYGPTNVVMNLEIWNGLSEEHKKLLLDVSRETQSRIREATGPRAYAPAIPMPGLVTLLTDFGTRDAFVGIMKGVMLSIDPTLQLVDLTHDIPAQAVDVGGLVLRSAVPHFPDGTVHLAVVDPGVGTARAPIAVRTDRALLVGPDNGLLAPAVAALGGARAEPDLSRARPLRAGRRPPRAWRGDGLARRRAARADTGIASRSRRLDRRGARRRRLRRSFRQPTDQRRAPRRPRLPPPIPFR